MINLTELGFTVTEDTREPTRLHKFPQDFCVNLV